MSTHEKTPLVHKEFSEFAPTSLFGHLETLWDLPLAKPHCRNVSGAPLLVSNIKAGAPIGFIINVSIFTSVEAEPRATYGGQSHTVRIPLQGLLMTNVGWVVLT